MNNYPIALVPGDGIGPEIIREGVKVLNAVAEVRGFKLNFDHLPYSTDYYLDTGIILPENALEEMPKKYKAMYFGALGDPRTPASTMIIGFILKTRFGFDQYINLRPVKLYPNVESPLRNAKNIDIYMVRENIEDFYNGLGGLIRKTGVSGVSTDTQLKLMREIYECDFDIKTRMSIDDDYAYNIGFITARNSERVMRYSFELARKKGKKKLTYVDKENVLPQIYAIWREAFEKVSAEYPEIETEHAHADAITMWLVKKPEDFGVIVFPNLMGDIITDLGAGITGGLGFAAGGNINPEGFSMFEPIHGSAPKYAGKNVINPIATILSGGLMLDHLGEKDGALLVERAVWNVLESRKVVTREMGGNTSTSETGDLIAEEVYKLSKEY